jgi:oligopeptide/dipeptide ABC transporter ATP-binding protein
MDGDLLTSFVTAEQKTDSAVELKEGIIKNLVEVRNLRKYFSLKQSIFERKPEYIRAVDDVSFSIPSGSTFGLVGESGSGKSTIGFTISKLYEPTSGEVYFKGVNIAGLKEKEFRKFRKSIQIVFQNPISSLDPRMKVVDIIAEPIKTHAESDAAKLPKTEIHRKVTQLLLDVGLSSAFLDRYPHELSGGQAQRVAIARSLSTNPEFIILDEPTSALDVSVQAQIINLLRKLQREHNLTYLFISHDLSVVNYLSSVIAVMYLGKIVEIAPASLLFGHPLHPYTQALISSVPTIDSAKQVERVILSGEIPSPRKPPNGCRFHTRCPLAIERCKTEVPQLSDYGNNHYVACHRVDESLKFIPKIVLRYENSPH